MRISRENGRRTWIQDDPVEPTLPVVARQEIQAGVFTELPLQRENKKLVAEVAIFARIYETQQSPKAIAGKIRQLFDRLVLRPLSIKSLPASDKLLLEASKRHFNQGGE